jgi:hypothetical protein
VSYSTLIYGLNVQLNKQIPGIVSSELPAQTPDVDVRLGSLPSWFNPSLIKRTLSYSATTNNCNESSRLTIWEITDRNTYQFCYADGTQFLVDKDGTNVWATWPNETLTLEDTATYFLGPIMGFVLLLRGRVSLHASAVAIGDSAVAFVGPAGVGKSTTAAALADQGYRVLAEDVVTLDELGNSFLVQPGYPCIRLWPESVGALYGPDVDLPKLTPTWDKRFLDLTEKQYVFQSDPLPLSTIYLVNARSESEFAPFVQSVSQSEALMSLVSNTYATHLMNKQMRAKEFELLTRLLRTTTLRRLVPHSDPARIQDLCRTIVSDFESLRFSGAGSSTQPQFLHV